MLDLDRNSSACYCAVLLQLRKGQVDRRERDLRSRMTNVVAAYNIALEGLEQRNKAIAEKTKMIVARCASVWMQLHAV